MSVRGGDKVRATRQQPHPMARWCGRVPPRRRNEAIPRDSWTTSATPRCFSTLQTFTTLHGPEEPTTSASLTSSPSSTSTLDEKTLPRESQFSGRLPLAILKRSGQRLGISSCSLRSLNRNVSTGLRSADAEICRTERLPLLC